jgi:hypothetical protein
MGGTFPLVGTHYQAMLLFADLSHMPATAHAAVKSSQADFLLVD